MQRSSETIGAIAAALAKAQAELANPEKSLVATIRASNPREMDQTFRYAALSSGLDIVRKALGGHEIATVQTTAIDEKAGLIRLTTTLAHASGEWLSSEWPVCAISETVAPRRMGAALTYARRYALFTLVGIAGEDDLDAPDLDGGGNADTQPGLDLQPSAKPGTGELSFTPSGARRRGKVIRPPRIVLSTDQSKVLRDRMIVELGDLNSADEAADWVHKNLPAKNTLTFADAYKVEASFREWLATIEGGQPSAGSEGRQFGRRTFARAKRRPGRLRDACSGNNRRPPPPYCCEDHSVTRQGALQIRRHAALRRLRPHARRSAPRSLCSTARAQPQGQRRIHRSSLPRASSRAASIWG